jgi:hypothetical protein
MKAALIIVVLIVAGYLWYDYSKEKSAAASGPPVITDPWYAEVRTSNTIPNTNREIEMALFARAKSEADCLGGTQLAWTDIFKNCPDCKTATPKCTKELSPRYSRLFDDVPIPSAYLSATAAAPRERDMRVVIFGLTDEEGMTVCEILRKELEKNYSGPSHCVAPSTG